MNENKMPQVKEYPDDQKFKVNDDYMLREIAGEAILVPIGENTKISNAMINLNETSAYLWKLFEEPRTVSEALIEALKEYEGNREEMERDIRAYVYQAVPLDLIRPVQ